MEEQQKDDKFQLHLVYNKPFTDEEEIDIVSMRRCSSSTIQRYYCSAISARGNSTIQPPSMLSSTMRSTETSVSPASSRWTLASASATTTSGKTSMCRSRTSTGVSSRSCFSSTLSKGTETARKVRLWKLGTNQELYGLPRQQLLRKRNTGPLPQILPG